MRTAHTRDWTSPYLPAHISERPAPGRVSDVGEDVTYGRYVRLDHQNGYETLYAHASVTAVAPGEEVRKNEVIAISGSSGRSTAPHLHFEIFFEGVRVDPLELVQQP